MVRLRFLTSSKSVRWNSWTVVWCGVLFSFRAMHTLLCIPPVQQLQQQLNTMAFFDWKWQNSIIRIYAHLPNNIWFVIIWKKKKKKETKSNQNDQTKCNIHSEFEKFDQKEEKKFERACFFYCFLRIHFEMHACIHACVRCVRTKWRFSIQCIYIYKLYELAVLCGLKFLDK